MKEIKELSEQVLAMQKEKVDVSKQNEKIVRVKLTFRLKSCLHN